MANRALLVGINAYPPHRRPLRGCVNDVADITDLLKAKYDFADSDIRILVDGEATAARIRQQLEGWLVLNALPHDRLLFHFSGHGTRMPGRDGTVHHVICPVDFDFTEARALSDVDFSAIFRQLPVDVNFSWISDSCHSGDLARVVSERTDAIARYLPPPPEILEQINDLLERGAQTRSLDGSVERLKGLLIAGCKSDEESTDALFGSRANGALTYYLLQALRRADALTQGVETILADVQRALTENRYPQHPQLRGLAELRQKPFLGHRNTVPEGSAASIKIATDVSTDGPGQGGGIRLQEPPIGAAPRVPVSIPSRVSVQRADGRFTKLYRWLLPRRTEKRVAFVLGNSTYEVMNKLPGVAKDWVRVTGTLESLGFQQCFGGLDLSRNGCMAEFEKFVASLQATDTALIYYSGHGLQIGHVNYIVPVEFGAASPLSVTQLVDIELLIRRTQNGLGEESGGKTCLVFLDACRNNPFLADTQFEVPATRSVGALHAAPSLEGAQRGLSDMEIGGEETFIAFATAPGQLASDGSGHGPSPFTEVVTRYAQVRGGVALDDLMRWVAGGVREVTNGKQRPWNHDNLTRSWSFVPRDSKPTRTLAFLGALAGVVVALLSFDLEQHLLAMRGGDFVSIARLALAGLLFGSVIGYGIRRWGSPKPWAPTAACLGTAVSFLLGMWLLEPAAQAYQGTPVPRSIRELFASATFPILLNAIIATSMIFAIGAVAAGAISTRALRRPSAFVLALVSGALVTAIYLVVHCTQVILVIGNIGDAAPSTRIVSGIAVATASALWHGLLGFCIGHSLATYVPVSRREADLVLGSANTRRDK